MGAGEARKTKNSTVHRGDDEVAASAGEYMSKDEIRSAERAQTVLSKLGIEVPIKNRQALALMRGDPDETVDVALCSGIHASVGREDVPKGSRVAYEFENDRDGSRAQHQFGELPRRN